ncbi:hypothetical protein ACQP2K_13120 [Microbispora siamensis]
MRSPRVFYAGALAGFALAVEALVLLVGRAPLPVTLAVALAGGCCGPVVSGALSGLLAVLVPGGTRGTAPTPWTPPCSTRRP